MISLIKERSGQRHKNIIYFKKNEELDFWLQAFALSPQLYGGSTIGEVFYAASRIDEKNLNTWAREFLSLAERVEKQAVDSLNSKHGISASEAYQRAFTYYRCASLAMHYKSQEFKQTITKAKDCFSKFAENTNIHMEKTAISFENCIMPAYFMKPDNCIAKKPTLIMIGGGESYVEDLYVWGGAAAVKRGYNALIIDLPGQGATALDGMVYRHDSEVPMKHIVDYLLGREDVDSEGIVTFGISLGGYLVLRAASYEKRIKAVAASTPIVDWHQTLIDALPGPLKLTPSLLYKATSLLGKFFNPAQLAAFEKYFLWQNGKESIGEAVDSFKNWVVDVSLIECPVLCILGESEDETFKKQTYKCYDNLKGLKKLVKMTEEFGADAHVQVNNLALGHKEAFDFFDEVL